MILLILSFPPVNPIEIEQSFNDRYNNVLSDEEIDYIDNSDIFQNNIHNFDLTKKNNTINNNTNDLNPTENKITEEATGHPILKIVSITILITIFFVLALTAFKCHQIIKEGKQIYSFHSQDQELIDVLGDRVELLSNRADALLETIDRVRETSLGEWCPYTLEPLYQEHEVVNREYLLARDEYIFYTAKRMEDIRAHWYYLKKMIYPMPQVMVGSILLGGLDVFGLYYLIFHFK